jgi:FKBP-type peptidyl-prolyl cis-trans isomerase
MKFVERIGNNTLVILAGLSLFAACNESTVADDPKEQEQRFFDIYVTSRYPDTNPQASGLYYIENRAGTGESPGPEDWMLLNHVGYKIPEEQVFVSYIENVAEDNRLDPEKTALYGPFKMQNGTVNEGFTQGVSMMKEGGQATMFFMSDLGYGEKGNSAIGPYKSLKYEVELLEVIKDMDVYEQGKIDAYIDTISVVDTIYDPGTDAVMYYVIDHATDGDLIGIDSLVTLAYKGSLLDGRVFDEKVSDDPYTFTLGQSEFIKGWDLGLLRLREGEKARLIIPYPLAYGESGRKHQSTGLVVIPPYESLLFEIEVLSVGSSSGGDPGEVPQ